MTTHDNANRSASRNKLTNIKYRKRRREKTPDRDTLMMMMTSKNAEGGIIFMTKARRFIFFLCQFESALVCGGVRHA